jgi:hypothetical protein
VTHQAAFSNRVRNRVIFTVSSRGTGYPVAIHGKAEGQISAKDVSARDKGYRHDSAFLAERGCLGAANLPRHPAPAHQI